MIANAQARYKTAADNRHLPAPTINIGDQVFVLVKFIGSMCLSKKLSEKYLGPFKITDRPGSYFYRIKLPDHLQAIHPVFHVSQLELTLTSQIPNRTNLSLLQSS